MQEPFKGISFNFALFFIHCCIVLHDDVNNDVNDDNDEENSFRVYSLLILPFDDVTFAVFLHQ